MTRDFIIIFIGRISQALLGLVALRLGTKYLPAEEMGKFYLLISLIGYFSLVLIGPVGQFINRKIFKWYEENNLLNNLLIFSAYLLLVSFSSFPITYALRKYLNFLTFIDSSLYYYLTVVGVFFSSFYTLLPSLLNTLGHRLKFVLLANLGFLCSLLLSLYFIFIYEKNFFYWTLGQIGGQVIVTFASILTIILVIKGTMNTREAVNKLDKSSIAHVSSFVIPLALSAVMAWIMNDSYKFIVEKYSGAAYLGLMAVGFSVAQSISNVIESLVQQTYLPTYYKNINTESIEKRSLAWNNLFKISLPAYLFTTFFVTALSPFIATILLDSKFHSSYIFIMYGAWIQFFRVMAGVVSLVAHSEMNTQKILLPNIIGGGFMLLSTLGVSLAGAGEYIPLLLVISGLLACALQFLQMRTILDIKLNYSLILKIIFLSVPFFTSIFLYDYGESLLNSIAIVGGYSVLYVIYIYRGVYLNNR